MDLPPRVRALVEDNRVAKEQLRKARAAHKDQERVIQMQMQHIEKYKEEIRQLQEFKKSVENEPVSRKQLEDLQRQVEEKDHAIADSEKRAEVLELSVRVEQRKAKQAVAQAKREQAEAEGQRAAVEEELAERDKEIRALKIKVKKLEGAILPLRMREHEVRRVLRPGSAPPVAACTALLAFVSRPPHRMAPGGVLISLPVSCRSCSVSRWMDPIASRRAKEREMERLEELRAEVDRKLAKMAEPRVVLMTILVDRGGDVKPRTYKLASELTEEEASLVMQRYSRGYLDRKRVGAMRNERAQVTVEVGPSGGVTGR